MATFLEASFQALLLALQKTHEVVYLRMRRERTAVVRFYWLRCAA
jgi:uncharacterized protein YqgV (UPF0045/DUF77 family)